MTPRRIASGEFKAKCTVILKKIEQSGEEVIVTRHGKPVAVVSAASRRGQVQTLFRVSPRMNYQDSKILSTEEKWNAGS